MKFVLINFSKNSSGSCAKILNYASSVIESSGNTVCYIQAPFNITGCMNCKACQDSGKCISSEINTIAAAIEDGDGVIFALPTHYCACPANVFGILSRLLMSNGKKLKNKPAFQIGVARRGGAVDCIGQVDNLLHFSSMPIVTGTYPCIVYGAAGDEILSDAEGLQNVRVHINNLLWLAEVIKVGTDAGISPKTGEKKIKTDIHHPT